jgi:hypothetical protein
VWWRGRIGKPGSSKKTHRKGTLRGLWNSNQVAGPEASASNCNRSASRVYRRLTKLKDKLKDNARASILVVLKPEPQFVARTPAARLAIRV